MHYFIGILATALVGTGNPTVSIVGHFETKAECREAIRAAELDAKSRAHWAHPVEVDGDCVKRKRKVR